MIHVAMDMGRGQKEDPQIGQIKQNVLLELRPYRLVGPTLSSLFM
jgi:hypothetical protein